MYTNIDTQSLDGDIEAVHSNWKLRYLDSNQVDFFAILRLEQNDFKFGDMSSDIVQIALSILSP